MSEERKIEYVISDLVKIAIEQFDGVIRDIADTLANKIADECFGRRGEVRCLYKKADAVEKNPELISRYLRRYLDEKDRERIKEIEEDAGDLLRKAKRKVREGIEELLRLYVTEYLREWAVGIEMKKKIEEEIAEELKHNYKEEVVNSE